MSETIIKIDLDLHNQGVRAIQKFTEGFRIHEGNAASFIAQSSDGKYELEIKVRIKK